MGPIQRLPNETIDQILSLLSLQELIAVVTAWHFAPIDRFIFTDQGNISVMFEKQSLEIFSKILEIPRFTTQVRTLTIHVCHFLPLDQLDQVEERLSDGEWGYQSYDEEQSGDEQSGDEQFHQEQFKDEQTDEMEYEALLKDQDRLMESKTPLRCFTLAMEKLKQCENILISDEQLLHGICTLEDGLRKNMRGQLTFKSEASVNFVSQILSVILHANVYSELPVNSLSNLSLRSLIINIGLSYSLSDCNGIRPDMLPCLPAPITSICLLSITLDCNFLMEREPFNRGADFGNFIKMFPELQTFELLVVGEEWCEKSLHFLHSITIPKLQKLTLECLKCRKDDLEDFLRRHKTTLTEVDFASVHLDDESESWDSILQTIQDWPNRLKIAVEDCKPTVDD